MKKVLAILLAVSMIAAVGCSNGKSASGTSQSQSSSASGGNQAVILKMATAASDALKAFTSIGESYTKDHPNVTMEISVIPGGVAGFNTSMASKLAAGDAPDLFSYQWGTQITAYAKGGHLMDLSDIGVKDSLKAIKKPVNMYKGKAYAYPLYQQLWGIMYNKGIGEKAGVTAIPKTLTEFTADMDKIRAAGVQYPFIVPAKDGSGATGFVFCYLHQVVSGQNPDFYYQCVKGQKSWDGPEWRKLFEVYGKLLEYSSPDRLGLDPDNAYSRFARGEGAFLVGSPSLVKKMEDMNPALKGKLLYIPFPLYDNASDYATIADYDTAFSIWAKTKHPEEAKGMYKAFFTKDNSLTLVKAMNAISPLRDMPTDYMDASVVDQAPLLEQGKFTGFSEREWIPGVKEIMKKIVQEWMGGTDLDTTLKNLQKEHQRLLDANPDFIKEFEDLRANTTK